MSDELKITPYTTGDPEVDQEYADNLGRADFTPKNFDRMIIQHPYRIVWQKAILCSCLSEDGHPDPTCPACQGIGYVYFDPKQIWATTYGISTNKSLIPAGMYGPGEIKLTVRAQDQVTYHDRLTFVDSSAVYSENVIYDPDEEGYLDLRYQCTNMQAVMVLDQQIMDYSIDQNSRRLKINENIDVGTKLSVRYSFHPVYVVETMPHELRGTFVKLHFPHPTWFELPKQLTARREDMVTLDMGQTGSDI